MEGAASAAMGEPPPPLRVVLGLQADDAREMAPGPAEWLTLAEADH